MPARVLALAAILLTFSDARARSVEPVEAYTRARLDASLGFVVSGRVEALLVEEGQRVGAGEAIVRLADPEGEAQIRLLELRAKSRLEIDAADADLDLARVREEMVKGAASQGGASAFEVREAELETVRARLARDLFVQRQAEAALQLEQARRRHEQFTLRAPAAGVIDLLEVDPGETVQALEPVARLVATGVLLADVQAPTAGTLGLAPGDAVGVVFLLGDERLGAQASVRSIALVGDAASDTRRVTIEIPNERDLPAGTRVLVSFEAPASGHGPAPVVDQD